jgi:hypothetical protein
VTLSHDNIKVLRDFGRHKCRYAFGYARGAVGDNLFFYNNTLSVGLRALTERLYYVKGQDGFIPCPRPTACFSTLQYFITSVVRQLPERPPVWTREEFVQSYTGSKLRCYQQALARLTLSGVKRQMGFWKTFIKAEFYNGTSKANPCPRLIQPRTPE